MGIAPAEAKRMTMWEFGAVTGYWIEAHEIERPGSRLSAEEKDEIWEWMQTKDIPLSPAAARARSNGRGH